MISPKVIAAVPAHNEVRTVGTVVASLVPLIAEVVVVDDASTDRTGERAREAGAVVLRNERSRGYDASIDSGFQEAAKRGADIFLTFDADQEHDTRDVSRILAPILEGRADIVAGERPHIRHWGEYLFATYTRLRFGIRDPLCGLKAYRRNVYEQIGFFDTKQSIGTELMIRGVKKGFRLVLVPITLHQRADTSRFYALNLRGNIRILGALLRIILI